MKNKKVNKIGKEGGRIAILLMLVFSFMSLTQATPIENLVNSYSFDYYSDSIDIISVNDSFLDTNLNNLSDSLNSYFFFAQIRVSSRF